MQAKTIGILLDYGTAHVCQTVCHKYVTGDHYEQSYSVIFSQTSIPNLGDFGLVIDSVAQIWALNLLLLP